MRGERYEVLKDNLWTLLQLQAWYYWFDNIEDDIEDEKSNLKLETMCFKIGKIGWPNL